MVKTLASCHLTRRWLKGDVLNRKQHLRLSQCPGPKTDRQRRTEEAPVALRKTQRQNERREDKRNTCFPLRKSDAVDENVLINQGLKNTKWTIAAIDLFIHLQSKINVSQV